MPSAPKSWFRSLVFLPLILVFAAGTFQPFAAHAAEQNTLFLPLKINAPDQAAIADLADQALQKELEK